MPISRRFFRGTLAVGYAQRNYKSPIYANVGGLSAQGELTYFLSRNTDITLELHRQLDDAVIVGNGAFFDSAVALRVNHELFSNVLLEGNVAYQNQDYANSNLSYDIVRVGGHADYLINNRFRVRFSTDLRLSDLAIVDDGRSGPDRVGQDRTVQCRPLADHTALSRQYNGIPVLNRRPQEANDGEAVAMSAGHRRRLGDVAADLGSALRRRIWLLLGIAIPLFVVAVIVISMLQPRYDATTRIRSTRAATHGAGPGAEHGQFRGD